MKLFDQMNQIYTSLLFKRTSSNKGTAYHNLTSDCDWPSTFPLITGNVLGLEIVRKHLNSDYAY